MAGAGKTAGEDPGAGMSIFLLYDLVKGGAVAKVYAAFRPRFGAGPRTAVFAGLTAWWLAIPVPLLGLLPMEFFSAGFAARWSLYGAFPMVAAASSPARSTRKPTDDCDGASMRVPFLRVRRLLHEDTDNGTIRAALDWVEESQRMVDDLMAVAGKGAVPSATRAGLAVA